MSKVRMDNIINEFAQTYAINSGKAQLQRLV